MPRQPSDRHFADAGEVLESRYRMDVPVLRSGEWRTVSVSCALGFLAVLTVVHTGRDVLTALRATGPGWQTRVNALLQEALTQGRLKG